MRLPPGWRTPSSCLAKNSGVRKGAETMMPERQRIQIPMKESSWQLIMRALEYLMEYPDIGELEESREELAGIFRYIKKELNK